MKINEVVSPEKQRVDEFIWAPVTAALGGGLSYAMLAHEYGLNPGNWPKKAWVELGADIALGATGIGLAGIGMKTAAKAGIKTLQKSDELAAIAKAAVKNLRNQAGSAAKLRTHAKKAIKGADTAKAGRRVAKGEKGAGQFTPGSNVPPTTAAATAGDVGAATAAGPITRGALALGRGSKALVMKGPGKAMRGAGLAALAKTQAAQDLGAPEWVTGGTRKLAKAAEPHLPTWFPGKDEDPAAKKDSKPVAPVKKPAKKATPKPEKKRGPTALQQWKWGKGGKNFPGMNK